LRSVTFDFMVGMKHFSQQKFKHFGQLWTIYIQGKFKRYTTLTLTINLKEMVIINEMRNDPWYACIMNEIDWFFGVKTESKIPFESFNIRVGSQIIISWSLLQLYPKVKSCSINKETGKQALKVCFIQMV